MPRYTFYLRASGQAAIDAEKVDAVDDAEARSLAELRLLLDRVFTQVQVTRDGRECFRVSRDGAS